VRTRRWRGEGDCAADGAEHAPRGHSHELLDAGTCREFCQLVSFVILIGRSGGSTRFSTRVDRLINNTPLQLLHQQ
jgi:hypothetical protein